MAIGPVSIETQSQFTVPLPTGQSLFFGNGYAIVNFASSAGETDIHRDVLELVPGPAWRELHAVVPTVTPTSFAYEGAGEQIATGHTSTGELVTVPVPGSSIPLWAVDNCEWRFENGRIVLRSVVALRGGANRVGIMRVAYHLSALGILA